MYDFKNVENDFKGQKVEDSLIGYLLNALDPEESRRVEAWLRHNPDGERQLGLLRQSLQPLALDRQEAEPPPDLAARTLAFVAERCCADLPRIPAAPVRTLAFPRVVWQRIDVLVAACLLIIIGGAGLTWIGHLNYLADRTNCENDLRNLYVALAAYNNKHGELPSPHTIAQPPRNVAGLVVPKLIATGFLAGGFTFTCPGRKSPVPPLTFDEALNLPDQEFEIHANALTPCYGFTLGYRDGNGTLHGPKLNDEKSDNTLAVLMADCPPADPLAGNSPNHGGHGQNVLFLNGSIKFCTDRAHSFQGDDLYLNRHHKVEAGLDSKDNVVGNSRARP